MLEEPRFTSTGMLVHSKSSLDAMFKDFRPSTREESSYHINVHLRLLKEDPILERFLQFFISYLRDETEQGVAYSAAISVYAFMEYHRQRVRMPELVAKQGMVRQVSYTSKGMLVTTDASMQEFYPGFDKDKVIHQVNSEIKPRVMKEDKILSAFIDREIWLHPDMHLPKRFNDPIYNTVYAMYGLKELHRQRVLLPLSR